MLDDRPAEVDNACGRVRPSSPGRVPGEAMTTATKRAKLAKKTIKKVLKPAVRLKKAVIRFKKGSKPPVNSPVAKLRTRLMLTQAQFAPLVPVSPRTLASLEGGTAPTETVGRRLTELERLTAALSEVIKAESLGKWLRAPNPAFGGLKPVEVISRGEGDRLWEMIYFLRSGVPA